MSASRVLIVVLSAIIVFKAECVSDPMSAEERRAEEGTTTSGGASSRESVHFFHFYDSCDSILGS